MTLGGIILGVTAVFLPPLAVFVRQGCGAHLLINIGLLFLGWIPGVLHAWYVILEYPSFRQRRQIKKERRASMASTRAVSPYRVSRELEDPYARRRSASRPRQQYVEYERAPRPYSREEMYARPPAYHALPPPPRSKY